MVHNNNVFLSKIIFVQLNFERCWAETNGTFILDRCIEEKKKVRMRETVQNEWIMCSAFYKNKSFVIAVGQFLARVNRINTKSRSIQK